MIQAENELQAETWFFKIIVRLDYDKDFSDVLNARKKQVEHSLSTVSVIHGLHPRNQSLNICPWCGHHSKPLKVDRLTRGLGFAGLCFPFHER